MSKQKQPVSTQNPQDFIASLPKPIIEAAGQLFSRWQDEKEYEDPAEYETVFRQICTDHGFQLEDFEMNPFKFSLGVDDQTTAVISLSKFGKAINFKCKFNKASKKSEEPSIDQIKVIQFLISLSELDTPFFQDEFEAMYGSSKFSRATLAKLTSDGDVDEVEGVFCFTKAGINKFNTAAFEILKHQGFDGEFDSKIDFISEFKKASDPRQPSLWTVIGQTPVVVTDLEAKVLKWVYLSEFQDSPNVVGNHIWAPNATDFEPGVFKSSKSLGGCIASLVKKGALLHEEASDERGPTVALTEAGLQLFKMFESLSAKTPSKSTPESAPAKTSRSKVKNTPKIVEDAPSTAELEERLNDMQNGAVVVFKKGRGYANAGKKYVKSGVKIESFKIGKTEVKKGAKLFFKIGTVEVCGVFSHINKCANCPDGYVVVKFEGKNFERRQSRVSLTPTAE